MNTAWTFELTPRARKRLKHLDKPVAIRVLKALHDLTQLDDPRTRGKALTGNLAGLWRYRVGNYRIICSISDNTCIILALEIAHRSHIYRT